MAVIRKPHVKGGRTLISITIDPDQCATLDVIADAKRTSRAQLVREAVDLYLEANGHPSRLVVSEPEPAHAA